LGGKRHTKKGGGILCGKPEVKYAFIKGHQSNFSIEKMFDVVY
jgi:hypothetical protein